MSRATIWHENPELIQTRIETEGLDVGFGRISVPSASRRTYTTHVIPGLCGDCIFCETACPNLRYDRVNGIMEVNKVGCRGCGVCLPACPTSALQQRNSYLGRFEKEIMQLLLRSWKPPPASCNYCPVVTGEVPAIGSNDAGLRLVCSGRFEPALAIEAFARGHKNVLVIGCIFEGFPFKDDRASTIKAIGKTRMFMKLLGLNESMLVDLDCYIQDGEVWRCLRKLG